MSDNERTRSLITTAVIVVSVVFPVLSFLSTYGRFRARRVMKSRFFWDDWWIIISWVLAFSLSINAWTFAGISGVNYYKIDAMQGTEDSAKCLVVSSLLDITAVTVVKIGILCMYKRLFPVRWFKNVVWFFIALISCWGTIFFFLTLFLGDPVSAEWTGKGRLRFNETALGLAQVGSSMALDVIVLCLPIPLVARLQMPLRRKIAIIGIFWMGLFCCVAAAVRLGYLKTEVSQVAASPGYDFIYSESKQYLWMILEPNCSVIAANLPCFGPLLPSGKNGDRFLSRIKGIMLRVNASVFGSRFSTDGSRFNKESKQMNGSDTTRSSADASPTSATFHDDRDVQQRHESRPTF